MSAIFGIIYTDESIADPDDIRKMNRALHHRAIDGSATASYKNAFFGYCRHIINHTQQLEQLPLEDDEYLITSDSRLTNRDELIGMLGLHNKTAVPDSILILHAYRKWNKNCSAYLSGEFVFVIYEKATGNIYTAADHIGFKSLYYFKSDRYFVFSTEMKGIQAVGVTKRRFNRKIIVEYLSPVFSGKTYDDEIFVLKGAHWLFIDCGRDLKQYKYWNPGPTGKFRFKKDYEWAECTTELIINDLTKRLDTSYPVGVTLSGGLDSSFIAGVAASILKKQNKELFCFSSVLDEHATEYETDEKKFIETMSAYHTNIRQINVCPAPEKGPFSDWERSFERIERPTNKSLFVDDAINAAAHKEKVRLLLGGFGGDVTISYNGNSMIYEMIKQADFCKAFVYLKMRKKQYNIDWFRLLKRSITDYTNLGRVYNSLFGLFNEKEPGYFFVPDIMEQVNKNFKKEENKTIREVYKERFGCGRIGYALFTANHNYASFGIEWNAPLLSREMIEFFYDVPPEQFILNGGQRSLIRRAMEGYVPSAIQMRSDKGEFSPDFFRRFNKLFGNFLSDNLFAADPSLSTIIDQTRLKATLSELKMLKMATQVPIKSLYITQTIKMIAFLRQLKNLGYTNIEDYDFP